jgi:MOSC domain-containing protein
VDSVLASVRAMPFTIARLYRYPIKGLTAEALTDADLRAGYGIPCDRAFALALATSSFDAADPCWLPKDNFVTLARHERLAALDTRFDTSNSVLAIYRGGKRVASGAVNQAIGRAMIGDFFRAYLKNEVAGPPRLVGSTAGPMLSDHAEPGLSIIGLATIADIERVVGRSIDPLRFRANVYLAGTPAWAEFKWLGQDIDLGNARLRVVERITRCSATNVEPGTGIRDMTIPQSLQSGFGHTDCGVFATVITGGRISTGDPVSLVEP